MHLIINLLFLLTNAKLSNAAPVICVTGWEPLKLKYKIIFCVLYFSDKTCNVYNVNSYPYSFLFAPFGNSPPTDKLSTFGSMSTIRLAVGIADVSL